MAAKFKKTAKKTSGKTSNTAGKGSAQEQAERLSKTLSESAQQIWLAGVGAFGRAQAEGTKLFEGLVKEGLNLEQTARKFTGGQASVLRDAVESKVGQARERATDTWDRLEKVFEERVQRALVKLGVPGRDDLAGLSDRVDALTAELRRQGGAPAPRKAAKASAAKAPAKKAAAPRKAAAKSAAKPAKAARKSIARPKPPVAP
ncbi:Poly(Hydroxyalcanoate) granule associated protein [Lysobacter capsici AZ78]|uniref:Poly(Hydroxyalcanoate) granule associated protein n=1 Tax=Lysobacter capsici AZ78 TaxID=1444315 RepID=A0A108U6B2_9GAMM|nr:phasin family protein [Lysobacter capsici]KWS03332.1 Poly(Hydroxyalcanoate) granule associated protein [Lysobacter capsici AZ78]